MSDVLQQLTVSLSDRYRVESQIGRGGTAIVWRARDLKHDRAVAIKVLRPEIAAAVGTARFLREIALTARLSHPNILPLLDSGEADQLLFYVMPLATGETLRERVEREGQLSLEDALRILHEVGDALDYAHRLDIVHRDLKPENVLLQDGHALVADFGIARALAVAGAETLTSDGLALGTPAYMSPEQASGSSRIDGRTDVYALGCVLYELLAGEPPFTGNSPGAILARQLTQPPPSLAMIRPTLPAAFDDVIKRALAKSPADRYSTMTELLDALEQARTGPPPRQRARQPKRAALAIMLILAVALVAGGIAVRIRDLRSTQPSPADLNRIAVLYFDDASPDSSLAWLARGLTEDLIDALSSINGLTITSRNGVRPYIGSNAAPENIGRALGVGLLVDGTIEPQDSSGESIRVLVRLVEASTGVQLERLVLLKDRREPLALRRELTTDVEHLLRRRIGAHVRLRQDRNAAHNDVAWENLRRGRVLREDALTLLDAGDNEGAAARLLMADSLLTAAERTAGAWLQPTIERAELSLARALAAEAIADTLVLQGSLTSHLLEGLHHVDRALGRAPDSAALLAIRGEILVRLISFGTVTGRDTLAQAAYRDLSRATTLDPRQARALYAMSTALMMLGRTEEARLASRAALDADVYAEDAPGIISRLFFAALDRTAFAEADSLCAKGRRHYPANPNFRGCELTLLAWSGAGADAATRAAQLMEELDTVASMLSFQLSRRLYVAAVLARTPHLQDSARALLDRTVARARASGELERVALVRAWVLVLLGERDAALDVIRQFTEQQPAGRQRVATHPWFRPLTQDSVFRRLVAP